MEDVKQFGLANNTKSESVDESKDVCDEDADHDFFKRGIGRSAGVTNWG